jgi:hypothetical protein
MYIVLDGAAFVAEGALERIFVAAFPCNFPTPVNQTLINPVPPPMNQSQDSKIERDYKYQ